MPVRWMILAGSIIVLIAACGRGTGTEGGGGGAPEPDAPVPASSESGDQPAIGAFPDGPSALQDMYADGFPEPLVDPAEVISGGPPPDGIPPIDVPTFLDVASNLDVLPANEPVVALEINGDARAYPIRAMVWHEIVNDTVGGIPVAVTYCPLCNSAAAYDRRIDGAETTFGTSGRLFASALVMYDRATESLWTHYNGTSVIGVLTGKVLEEYPAPLLAWGDFRDAHPTGSVLDWTATGYGRDYGRNPYTGYDDPDGTPFLFRGALDDRETALQRVVGIAVDDESVAFTLEAVSGDEGKATAAKVGGDELVIFWKPGQASALDDVTIAGGMDVGSVGVFQARAEGQQLSFEHNGVSFVDRETGSSWTITGEAVAGPLAGVQLERIPHLDTFWFAWSTYQPDTELVDG
jgi:hypothetical protein